MPVCVINVHFLTIWTTFHLIDIICPPMSSIVFFKVLSINTVWLIIYTHKYIINILQLFTMGFGGKVQGTRPCFWWKGRTTAGSTGIQGTRLEVGGLGTELWICWRLYAPRVTFPLASLYKVTNGSPALCAIRYRPCSNLQNQIKPSRVC